MANSVTHAALPFPVKGARFSLIIPYLDADGDPTDPTTPDTERSIDAAAFADCTEEVSTISGSNGTGYITLTGDETNGSMIAVAAKVASGPKPTLATIYPRVLPSIRTGTAQAGAASTITLDSGASAIDDFYVGCIVKTTGGTGGGGGSGSLGNQARVITDYVGSTKVATVEPSWETNPDSTTTFAILHTEMALYRLSDMVMISGDAGAADAAESFFDGTGYAGTNNTIPNVTTVTGNVNGNVAGSVGSVTGNVGGNVAGSVGSVTGAVGSVTGNVGGNVVGSIGSLATQAKADVNAEADTALADVGVTTTVTGRIDAAISTRATPAQVNTEVDTALADYDAPTKAELDAAVAPLATAANLATVDTEVGTVLTRLGTPSNLGSGATVAANLVDIEGQTDDIGAAGAGLTALGDARLANLNATVSSRLAAASYTTPPSVADILAGVIEGAITLKGALRLALAALSGKSTGGGTNSVNYRDTGDTKNRIAATVDSNGNRTAVTRDVSD